MITVTIWHNVAHDGEGRPTAMLDGYRPGDPMVRVFTYQADPAGRPPEEIAEEAFDTFNDHPRNPEGRTGAPVLPAQAPAVAVEGGRRGRRRSPARRRKRPGWTLVRDGLNEVRADEHGTHPLPLPGRAPGRGPAPEPATEDHG